MQPFCDHGFGAVVRETEDQWGPTDSELLSMRLLIRDHSKILFLLVLWTQHITRIFPTRRVLSICTMRSHNAISMLFLHRSANWPTNGCAQRNETFGRHASRHYGRPREALVNTARSSYFTVYDEEVRIPLLLINKNIFKRAPVSTLGRQIDIAPTILPIWLRGSAAWQGETC